MQNRFNDMKFNFRNRKYPMLMMLVSIMVVLFAFYSSAMSLRVGYVDIDLMPSDFNSLLDFGVYNVLMLLALGCFLAFGAVLGVWGLLWYQEKTEIEESV